MSTIKKLLIETCPIVFTPLLANQIIKYCLLWETRDEHSLALNSPYLGMHKCFFTTKDQEDFFNLFDTNGRAMSKLLSSHDVAMLIQKISQSELKKILIKLDAVDPKRRVQSDPFNIFAAYTMYRAMDSKLPNGLKQQLVFTIFKIFQYKFFTSIVNHRFKYGCDESTMRATIDNLSNKFAITQQGTWKAVIEARAANLSNKNSIHYDTLTSFSSDPGVLYLITDVQTRVRTQIQQVTNEYYKAKERGDKISAYGLSGTDLDGNKIVVSQTSTFDTMITNIMNEMMSVHQWIEPSLISTICKMYNNIRPDMFKAVLIRISALAVEQSKYTHSKKIEKGLDYINNTAQGNRYVGLRALTTAIIQKTYRHCIINKTDMTKKLDILKVTKDVYSSSRISDSNITDVRDSVTLLMDLCNVSKRPATIASLKIAIVVYVIIKTFKYV